MPADARGRAGRLHVVLLAGGSGTRFWPLSRADRPKQLVPLASREPLLVDTWKRVRRLAPPSRIWVVTPRRLAAPVRQLLPGLRPDRLVLEPAPRDTAPAVVLACAAVAERDPRAVAAIFPTDHVVREARSFEQSVATAVRAARRGGLVCLGIRPDHPATGYGYLACGDTPGRHRDVAVERFVEKPELARARRFVRSGRYLWNAGMFVWRVERLLAEAERVAPEVVIPVREHRAGRRGAWSRARKVSLDYAVMERARGVRVVALDAGWDDVGSWDAASRLRLDSPAAEREHLLLNSPGSAVFGAAGRLVALVDLPGVALVDTPDALLVVPRASAQRVREVVAELERRGRRDLL
jgi:mannose-1-phosphate guanylyltransferase